MSNVQETFTRDEVIDFYNKIRYRRNEYRDSFERSLSFTDRSTLKGVIHIYDEVLTEFDKFLEL